MEKLKNKDYKILNQKTVLRTHPFSVVKSRIKLPNKNIVEWHHTEGQQVVSAVVLTKNNYVILTHEFRVAAKGLVLDLPGGKTKAKTEKERIKELNRELQEEIGIKGKRIEKLASALREPHSGRIEHVYLVRDLEKSRLNPDKDEIIETVKLPLDKAIKEVLSGRHTTDYPTITGLLLAKEKLRI